MVHLANDHSQQSYNLSVSFELALTKSNNDVTQASCATCFGSHEWCAGANYIDFIDIFETAVIIPNAAVDLQM